MLATHRPNQETQSLARRGVVLILVLAMLAIMALIGVTFATLSGQAQVGARYYAEGRDITPKQTYFDYALNQLINDTNNPRSAIRGHSLLRDMYGHDGRSNGYIPRLPAPLNQPLTVTGVTFINGFYTITTNIPTNNNTALIRQVPSLFNLNATGWTLRLQQWIFDAAGNGQQLVPPLTQTFEVINDDATGQFHVFTLSRADLTTPGLIQPDTPGPPGSANIFELDARFMRAFNGTGMSLPNQPNSIPPDAINFLYNNISIPGGGYTDPNNFSVPAMDEDYDAPDHENLFLAWQSADGQVMIPSFHRPNQIIYDPNNGLSDWDIATNSARSKFLRPRRIDHPASGDTFPDLIPDFTTGQITYDVDNDGDGITDSVWIDLGFPPQRGRDGKLFKPLFSFMVIGLNGRLPLNTAGNLQKRTPTDVNVDEFDAMGTPTGDVDIDYQAGQSLNRHASHVGYSPFEINPGFALTNSVGLDVPVDAAPPDYPLTHRDGTTLLRQILTGVNDPIAGVTPGRYGEPEAFAIGRVPAAGRSYNLNPVATDYIDSNFNGFDFFPRHNYDYANPPALGNMTAPFAHPELPRTDIPFNLFSPNLTDATGRLVLPAERFRYFLTPLDITGSGLVMEFDNTPSTSQGTDYAGVKFGLGYDGRGRVSYFAHYRPPGVPAGYVIDTNADDDLRDENIAINATSTPGNPTFRNVLHGYESHRNPGGRDSGNPAIPAAREFMARAPFNVVPPSGPADLNKRLPTFDRNINSFNPPQITQGMYPGGSLALHEDAQLNLYEKTPFDAPFGPTDLEWLYRRQDSDGTALFSRLESLAQLQTGGGPWKAFVEDDGGFNSSPGITALTRRRLFSVDTWETNRFAWFQNFFVPGNTPSLAHSGRKINLNYPLPISNDYNEPVRLKWVSEAYTLMKELFYPGFNPLNPPGLPTDPTPVDFARLGQFAVNIIDFRDPDATMTRFVNPDLKIRPAETNGNDLNGNGIIEPAGVTWRLSGDPFPLPEDLEVVQWGMEYLPVALHEVLAYSFTRRHNNPTDPDESGDPLTNPVVQNQVATRRLWIEMANMLSEDADGAVGHGGNASDLTLNGWGFIITADDPTTTSTIPTVIERPNTVTGQLHVDTIKNFYVPIKGGGQGQASTPIPLANNERVRALEAQPNGNPLPNYPALTGTQDNFHVLGHTPPPTNSPTGSDAENPRQPRVADVPLELVKQLPPYTDAADRGKAEYLWLHLVRPANPNAVNMAIEPKVVVDSIRFPYIEGTAIITNPNTDNEDANPGATARLIYSVGRSQPYRGGHAVPDSHRFDPPYPYGWSEQTSADLNSSQSPDIVGQFDFQRPMGTYETKPITRPIEHSLGVRNHDRENWDYFHFLDRDFSSVAELLLVPECPPGLFTKKFVEDVGRPFPDDFNTDGFPGSYPHVTPPDPPSIVTPPNPPDPPDVNYGGPTGPNLAQAPDLLSPHAFPYLPDRFYYWNAPTPNDRAAWYMLFEMFDVPSPVAGAIGPVAQGDNGDWFRQDVRPGALNLNLIIDEEVFFGLVDDPRLNRVQAFPDYVTANTPGTGIPRVVTAIDALGNPTFSYPVSKLDPASANPSELVGRGYYDPSTGTAVMKAAFADFLKLRHGGSGFIGISPASATPDIPFRSFTALNPAAGVDIYDTILRPARLRAFSGDLGTMPERLSIPPRGLFQIADLTPAAPVPPNELDPAANPANLIGNHPDEPTFPPTPLTQDHLNLTNQNAYLFDPDLQGPASLGSATPNDRRRHTLWRTEMLQKIINNSTVRTHQYAVWVTVGFFEVVSEGDPSKVGLDPNLAIDRLGKEIGRDSGQAVRYRMFAIVDRTRAIGFNPLAPEDFRKLVVFQRTIE